MTSDHLAHQVVTRSRAGDYLGALALRERQYAALRTEGDDLGAGRLAAYQIAFDHVALFGNAAVSAGWLERGIRLVGEAPCEEAGWVALARALHAASPGEREHWITTAERIAESFGAEDLYFDALAHRGLMVVETGRAGEGMRLLDEAAAAAHSGEVQDLTVAGEIYCKLMVACETVLDVPRAEEWQRVLEPLEHRMDVAWASAICRMHVGAVWTAAGRWGDAERELRRSVELYDATYRALRPAACARLAELRVRQGRFGEADDLLESGREDSFSIRPAARLAWERCMTELEREMTVAALAESLVQHEDEVAHLPSLALLAELQLATGQSEAAGGSVERLADLATSDLGAALTGYVRLAGGRVATAVADSAGPHLLRSAVRHFATARLPLEEAIAKVELAEAVAATDPGLALAQVRGAAETLESLGVAQELDRALRLLRGLGGRLRRSPRARGVLTGREHEVLGLLAEGLSNPEIADRLFLSKRTVAHHVSHVLAKLGVRNRAEAAAWFVGSDEGHGPR